MISRVHTYIRFAFSATEETAFRRQFAYISRVAYVASHKPYPHSTLRSRGQPVNIIRTKLFLQVQDTQLHF